MKLLENKTSIITGAGSGIGMETVKLFAESGSNIILAGRRLAPLEKIRSEIKKYNITSEAYSVDIENGDEAAKFGSYVLDKYEKEGNPYYASARIWDDGVISPMNTRETLILALQAIQHNPIPDTNFPVFRM